MIDAYEIGIQLLLQDEVSAGLVVINRGLADVDQAIAVTSARLATLVQEAGTANKAVAAVASAKPAGQMAPQPNAGANLVETAHETRGVQDNVGSAQVMAPPAAAQISDVVPVTAPVSEHRPAEAEPGTRTQTESQAVVAPVQRAPEVEIRKQPIIGIPKENGSNSPSREKAKVSAQADLLVLKADVPSVAGSARWSVTPPKMVQAEPSVGVTASLNGPPAEYPKLAPDDKPKHSEETDHLPKGNRVISPWPGVESTAVSTEGMRLQEKPAAPTAQERERADAGTGSVMLDGRLVGQWLSEHLAREASRPPGGTSFFDPRQAPAWNVAGVL